MTALGGCKQTCMNDERVGGVLYPRASFALDNKDEQKPEPQIQEAGRQISWYELRRANISSKHTGANGDVCEHFQLASSEAQSSVSETTTANASLGGRECLHKLLNHRKNCQLDWNTISVDYPLGSVEGSNLQPRKSKNYKRPQRAKQLISQHIVASPSGQ